MKLYYIFYEQISVNLAIHSGFAKITDQKVKENLSIIGCQ